ncbi:zinc finger and SCAN domain-containing protein 31-like [Salarias fasciatus]|uniref:Zinc finger and SCAN domain-containing protein 31-like n=1 Tax=Salarias fasciatus TaxID=181472 RepID=A0A672H6G1_SALFA|nr:zinc finger and SCAN domain-containing protein 31-like [Salarias fasciatus]
MTSVQALREFINQRLAAAAGEIFTVFQQTIVQYEEEIDRQHRFLEIILKPQVKLHRTELQQHHGCSEEQRFQQETDCCLEQGEPEPPQIKEEPEEPQPVQIKREPEEPGLLQLEENQEEPEPSQIEDHEELGTNQEGARVILQFESDSFRVPAVEEQSYSRKPDTEQLLSHDYEVHHEKKIGIFHSERMENCSETVPEKPELCQNSRTVTEKKTVHEICGKTYNQQLLVHVKTHSSERPYSCRTCGKSFRRQDNLLVHFRTHTGEKPYRCKTCGKSFNQHSILLRHTRTHTREKPYSCKAFGESFH